MFSPSDSDSYVCLLLAVLPFEKIFFTENKIVLLDFVAYVIPRLYRKKILFDENVGYSFDCSVEVALPVDSG